MGLIGRLRGESVERDGQGQRGQMLDFLARYPDIEVELSFNARFVDLVEEGVDVALRLGAPDT